MQAPSLLPAALRCRSAVLRAFGARFDPALVSCIYYATTRIAYLFFSSQEAAAAAVAALRSEPPAALQGGCASGRMRRQAGRCRLVLPRACSSFQCSTSWQPACPHRTPGSSPICLPCLSRCSGLLHCRHGGFAG